MLKTLSVSSPGEIKSRLEISDPNLETWIVSDLKSKLEIQEIFLDKWGAIEDASVLRASELWLQLLKKTDPEIRIISADIARTLIQHYLSDEGVPAHQANRVSGLIFDHMETFLPVFLHREGTLLMDQWLKENPKSEVRWGRIYRWCRGLWKIFDSQKYISPTWVSSVLLHCVRENGCDCRPLVFFLGADLNPIESELISLLSKQTDVTVLLPEVESKKDYSIALQPYTDLDPLFIDRSIPRRDGGVQFRKFSSMLGEVKYVVSQVRQSIMDGLRPEEIAIVASDIEEYWPVFFHFFAIEGIPCNKDQSVRYQTFPLISKWMARLKVLLGEIDSQVVETDCFALEEEELLPFEKFRTLFSAIYDSRDFSRHRNLEELYLTERLPQGAIDCIEFLAWAIKNLPRLKMDQFAQVLIQNLLTDWQLSVPRAIKMPLSSWFPLLENMWAKKECIVEKGDTSGVQFSNIYGAHFLSIKKYYLIGMTEEGLQPHTGVLLDLQEIQKVKSQIGFSLAKKDKMTSEFEIQWILNNPEAQIEFCVPQANFEGKMLAASRLWLTQSAQSENHDENVTVPPPTRWDVLQRGFAEQPENSSLLTHVKRDLGAEDFSSTVLHDLPSLSASSLENYWKCPFIFTAQKLLKLVDIPFVDLDTDRMSRGKLIHSLFEIISDHIGKNLNDDDLGRFVEEARDKEELVLADQRLWGSLKKRYIDLARRFLQFEAEQRSLFPENHIFSHEALVKGKIQVSTGKLLNEDSVEEDCFPITGRIDRIETDRRERYVVVDYKSTSASLNHFSKWIEKGSWQLPLYVMALEQGLVEGVDQGEVVAALYFIAKDFNKDIGFKHSDHDESLFSLKDRKRNKLNEEGKQTLLRQVREEIIPLLQGISQGKLGPNPKVLSDCTQCGWNKICRFPLLN